MLAQKNIETKKMILFIAVICIMISGTVFFTYKNYSLTSSQENITMDVPAEKRSWIDDKQDIQEKDTPTTKFNNIFDEQTVIDLDILSDPKFIELREGYTSTVNFEIGKKNPFSL